MISHIPNTSLKSTVLGVSRNKFEQTQNPGTETSSLLVLPPSCCVACLTAYAWSSASIAKHVCIFQSLRKSAEKNGFCPPPLWVSRYPPPLPPRPKEYFCHSYDETVLHLHSKKAFPWTCWASLAGPSCLSRVIRQLNSNSALFASGRRKGENKWPWDLKWLPYTVHCRSYNSPNSFEYLWRLHLRKDQVPKIGVSCQQS